MALDARWLLWHSVLQREKVKVSFKPFTCLPARDLVIIWYWYSWLKPSTWSEHAFTMITGMWFSNLKRCLGFELAETILGMCFSHSVDFIMTWNMHPIFNQPVVKSPCSVNVWVFRFYCKSHNNQSFSLWWIQPMQSRILENCKDHLFFQNDPILKRSFDIEVRHPS